MQSETLEGLTPRSWAWLIGATFCGSKNRDDWPSPLQRFVMLGCFDWSLRILHELFVAEFVHLLDPTQYWNAAFD